MKFIAIAFILVFTAHLLFIANKTHKVENHGHFTPGDYKTFLYSPVNRFDREELIKATDTYYFKSTPGATIHLFYPAYAALAIGFVSLLIPNKKDSRFLFIPVSIIITLIGIGIAMYYRNETKWYERHYWELQREIEYLEEQNETNKK